MVKCRDLHASLLKICISPALGRRRVKFALFSSLQNILSDEPKNALISLPPESRVVTKFVKIFVSRYSFFPHSYFEEWFNREKVGHNVLIHGSTEDIINSWLDHLSLDAMTRSHMEPFQSFKESMRVCAQGTRARHVRNDGTNQCLAGARLSAWKFFRA